MTRFRRIAVLKGGPSAERDVSLRSGSAVARGLAEAGYDVVEVEVRARELEIPADIEAVFIALHGEFGEDGELQALLDRTGLPYTGSGAAASRAAFDKEASKRVFVERGVPTPAYEVLRRGMRRTIPFPAVVKPACQGSTIGVHIVRAEPEWAPALEDALKYGGSAVVERYIAGRELTVGLVGDEVLPVVEIEAPHGWYDYGAKYTKGATRYAVPAALDGRPARLCAEAGRAAFDALGCRGFGRTDIRLSPDGCAYVLEVNSIPGFTETSLLPMAAKQRGLGFPELCAKIIEAARIG